MRARLLLLAVLLSGGFAATGCGSDHCERLAQVNQDKQGDCDPSPFDRGACQSGLSACTDADKGHLDTIIQCQQSIAVCSADAQADYQTALEACLQGAQSLSEGCRDAVFAGGIPGQDDDAGVDAGVPDAGIQPDTDGGGALDLYFTANETQIAVAWTQSQPGTPATWHLVGYSAADVREDPIGVAPAQLYSTQDVGAGVKKKYFVYGLDPEDALYFGEVDAGVPMDPDGGTPMCNGPLDCPVEQICNLGSCQVLPCTNSNVCPAGYLCDTVVDMRCERQFGFGDGGVMDAGMVDPGDGPETPLPFVSELREISSSQPAFSQSRVVSGIAATHPDLVAIDTARQFMIMDQDGQVFGYYTRNRGASWQSNLVDPIGQRPRVAYEPQSRTLFACYNAVGGVRVRRSRDFGRTWDAQAVASIVNLDPMDGGTAPLISDCDIAPWSEGSALVVAVEGDAVKMWTVSNDGEDLAVVGPEMVWPGDVDITSPRSLRIATLPSDFLIHVVFSITRPLTTGGNDTEIMGMYREQGSLAFEGPKYLHNPNAYPQYDPDVAIDPVSKRGIAAFVSREGNNADEFVYATMWMPQQEVWATGSDMDVFEQDNQMNEYRLFPSSRPDGRKPGETWAARNPSVAVTRDGKIAIAFGAGEVVSNFPSLKPYTVGFDFEIINPVLGGSVKGWYVGPAVRITDTQVFRTQIGEVTGPLVAADQQISLYYAFIEGVGNSGDTPNRPVILSRPK